MRNATPRSNQDEMTDDCHSWREEFCRRMGEQGMIVHLPRPGAAWTLPALPMPVMGDELSRFVVEQRRAGG